jgi:hypothetical protein
LLPEGDTQATFEQYQEDLETIIAEKAAAEPVVQKLNSQQKLLSSDFKVDLRPGYRPSKISHKLREEIVQANRTSHDEEYTTLLKSVNQFLEEIFRYRLPQMLM